MSEEYPLRPIAPSSSASEKRSSAPRVPLGFAILFVSYAAFILISLPDYGPTWDVSLEFPRATAYVSHALGEGTPSGVSPWHQLSYERARSSHGGSSNGCLPSLVAASTGKIFYEKLGVLDYIDAYHLGLALLWLLFVFHYHARLAELHGPRLALVATVLLALAPRIVAHVPNNMKDIPALAFGTAALLELAVAFKRERPRRIYATAILVACAVSSKFVAGIVAVPGAALVYLALRNGGLIRRNRLSYLVPLACIPIVTALLFIAHWPYLWVSPSGLWARIVELSTVIGSRAASGPSIYPFAMAAMTTPILVLVGLASAAVFSKRKPADNSFERALLVFYAVWMFAVLGVFGSGRIQLFDGVRHFLLFMPPAAILSAWGLLRASDSALGWIEGRGIDGRWPKALLGPLLVSVSALPIVLYHPYEVTYFNGLVGGLRGATEIEVGFKVLAFEPRDYWGTSVRASVDWANEHLPTGAALWVSLPPDFGSSQLYRLRPDLVYAQPTGRNPERPHYLIFVNRERWFRERENDAIQNGELVHFEEIQGIPLSFVYRLGGADAE